MKESCRIRKTLWKGSFERHIPFDLTIMANDVYFSNVPPRKNTPEKQKQNENAASPPRETRSAASVRRASAAGKQNGERQRQSVEAATKRSASASVGDSARRAPKKKRHGFRRFLSFLLVLILLAAVGTVGMSAYVYTKVLSDYEPVPMQKGNYADPADLMHSDSVYNILLMGVDQASTDASTRSDSMILLSIDKEKHLIKLTTFMRDMYVSIPGYGKTKLTHACMYEGPQLTVDTIELNFNIRIDAYAKIGYDIFIELVNGVGGITVAEIDETEARALAEEGVYVEPGQNIYLTGEQAIKYVRIRHWQSDFDRTERQREAITLIIDRAKRTPPHKLLALAQTIASQIECTIPKADILQLGFSILPCLFNGIAQQQIPADGTWWDAVRDSLMVLELDFDKNQAILKNFIYGG